MTKDVLLSAWAEELGAEPAPDDNFFEAGGDSLKAAKLVAKARRAGLTLSLADFLAAPSVNGLLARLGEPLLPAKTLTSVQAAVLEAVRESLAEPGLTMRTDLRTCGPWEEFSERLRGVLRERFAFDVPADVVARATTVSALCVLLRGSANSDSGRCLVRLREGTDGAAFYFVHPLAGSVARFSPISQRLPARHRVYGLQAIGLTPGAEPDTGIEQMARRYVAEVVENGDIDRTVFAGYSFGATVALEVVRILRAEYPGRHRVAFIDGEPCGGFTDPRWAAFYTLSRNALGIGEPGKDLLDLPLGEALAVLRERAVAAGILPAGFPADRIERIFATACATQTAHNGFQPRFFDGDVQLFASTEDGQAGIDAWRKSIADVRVTWIEANHVSIMEDCSAEAIAAGLSALA
ncbi:alpha/beta fold hydrolase [Amycolatopsis sp. NPDC059657]|uniref:thioesterase domain-containing protein n=1 Tax=Amycolatopsis sp. NPDC059657 TaxID=3346899 RepID=UPI00366EFC14